MLFKTLSASLCGIDACLVEGEVDGGSARMSDFHTVGLPEGAVKESRERVKSALRNCAFEFPHGQGVTISLAPAEVPKEGSAFDLPMALGLTGCMGHFFGKVLDKRIFLGQLSLDGSVRPVRGALSTALAAREVGLKSVAVPEANARETRSAPQRGRPVSDSGPFLSGVAVAVRGAAISLQEQLGDPRAAPPLTRFPYVCYP